MTFSVPKNGAAKTATREERVSETTSEMVTIPVEPYRQMSYEGLTYTVADPMKADGVTKGGIE